MAKPDIDIALRPVAFDVDNALAEFRRANATAGAIASFIGQVRDHANHEHVAELALEHYPGVAEREIADFAQNAAARWPLTAILIVHRVGVMTPGEPIVLVTVAADHRRPAFLAVDFLMDYLKSRAPFWKKETTNAGERWIEPRAEDYSDVKRWQGD